MFLECLLVYHEIKTFTSTQNVMLKYQNNLQGKLIKYKTGQNNYLNSNIQK